MPTNSIEKEHGWVSVTEVLDAFIPKGLLDWYLKTGKKEAKRLSTVAMKIGTRVDELIQEDVKFGAYKLTSKDPIEVKNCMEAWKQFKQDYEPNIRAIQVEVKEPREKVIGHIDLITDRIIDVKCSASIKDNYDIQVSKYDYMYTDKPFITEPPAILRLDKNLATYEYRIVKDKDTCVKVFDGLLTAFRYYNPQRGEETI